MSNDMIGICRLSGIDASIRRKRLMEYRQLERFLEQARREAQHALSLYDVARAGEVVSRVALFISDVVIQIASSGTGAAGIAIAKAYDGGKLLVDAAYSNVDAGTGMAMIARNKADIGDLVLEHAKVSDKDPLSKAVFIVDQCMQLYKWWNQSGKQGFSGRDGIKAGISTLDRQLGKIRQSIKELECQPQM